MLEDDLRRLVGLDSDGIRREYQSGGLDELLGRAPASDTTIEALLRRAADGEEITSLDVRSWPPQVQDRVRRAVSAVQRLHSQGRTEDARSAAAEYGRRLTTEMSAGDQGLDPLAEDLRALGSPGRLSSAPLGSDQLVDDVRRAVGAETEGD